MHGSSLSGFEFNQYFYHHFKALANFQWDRLLQTDIVSKEYLDGGYQLGQQYPDLCSSIFLLCERGAAARPTGN